MATTRLIAAAIDPGSAAVIAAIFGAAGALAARIAPKTRVEAAVDRATARLSDAQSWQALVEQHRTDAEMWRAEVVTLRRELAERDDRIDRLETEVERLRARVDRTT